MSVLGNHLRELQRINGRLEGYLIGFKHGMLWADVEHRYQAQIKEINDMLAMLEERNGQEIAAQDHPRP